MPFGNELIDAIAAQLDKIVSQSSQQQVPQQVSQQVIPQAIPAQSSPSLSGLGPFTPQIPGNISDIIANYQSPQPQNLQPQNLQQSNRSDSGQPNRILEFLKAMAVPAITTGVGLGVPGALPGAAGFMQGYGEAQEKKREKEFERSEEKSKRLFELKKLDLAEGKKQQKEERLTKQYSLNNAYKLRNEFEKLPQVKDYINISTNINAMEALVNNAIGSRDKENYVGVDQALITMFNKLTDPASVVRESEYARTPKNLPVVNSMLGAIQKVNRGGAGLTDADRIALIEAARIIEEERKRPYDEAVQDYMLLANEYDLDPRLVVKGASDNSQALQGQMEQNDLEIYSIRRK